jgi:hypothetical protein
MVDESVVKSRLLWQPALTSGFCAKQGASTKISGTTLVSESFPGRQTSSLIGLEHQVLTRWKSSSGLDPTGEANAQDIMAAKTSSGASIITENFGRRVEVP